VRYRADKLWQFFSLEELRELAQQDWPIDGRNLMLPKEKRRVGWSLAVGAVVAGLIAGYYYFQAFEANQRLRSLVTECEKKTAPAIEGLQPGYSLDDFKPPPRTKVAAPTLPPALSPDDSKPPPGIEDPLKLAPVEDLYHFFPGVKSIEDKAPLPEGYVVESCDPKNLVGYEKLPLFQARLMNTAEEADDYRTGRIYALIAFLIFCLPLAWYLILDRIRELSAAISGRDRGL
jgi:hypothetical protein